MVVETSCQLNPVHSQVSLSAVPNMLTPPKRMMRRRFGSYAMPCSLRGCGDDSGARRLHVGTMSRHWPPLSR